MKTRQLSSLMLLCLFVAGSFATPARAVVSSDSAAEALIIRATGQFNETIPAHSIMPLGNDSVPLNSGEVVTYNCTYTPRGASVKFGYIGPDGYFYGLSGFNGSINKGIQVSNPGSYTLAIWNQSDEAVTVKGTVNY